VGLRSTSTSPCAPSECERSAEDGNGGPAGAKTSALVSAQAGECSGTELDAPHTAAPHARHAPAVAVWLVLRSSRRGRRGERGSAPVEGRERVNRRGPARAGRQFATERASKREQAERGGSQVPLSRTQWFPCLAPLVRSASLAAAEVRSPLLRCAVATTGCSPSVRHPSVRPSVRDRSFVLSAPRSALSVERKEKGCAAAASRSASERASERRAGRQHENERGSGAAQAGESSARRVQQQPRARAGSTEGQSRDSRGASTEDQGLLRRSHSPSAFGAVPPQQQREQQ